MPKRYPQWLDNSVAIDLRSLAERQEVTFKKISALREQEEKLLSTLAKGQRLLNDVRQDLKTEQLEFQGINFAITKILRENVPRFIQAGNMILADDALQPEMKTKIITLTTRRKDF